MRKTKRARDVDSHAWITAAFLSSARLSECACGVGRVTQKGEVIAYLEPGESEWTTQEPPCRRGQARRRVEA